MKIFHWIMISLILVLWFLSLRVVVHDMIHWDEYEWGDGIYMGERDSADVFGLFFIGYTLAAIVGLFYHAEKLMEVKP